MATQLSIASRVRIDNDVLFQELQGEAVLLNLKTGIYLGLDKLGTRIWQLLEKQQSLSQVLETILQEYDVGHDRCAADLLDLIVKMEKQGLLTIG